MTGGLLTKKGKSADIFIHPINLKIYPDFPDTFGPPLKDEEVSQHQAILDVGLTRAGFCSRRCGFPCGAGVVAANNIGAGRA